LAVLAFWDASAEEQKKQVFTWQPERSTKGPILIIVNIDDQVAFVYRNGIQIGQTSVSTGRPGYPTPTGYLASLARTQPITQRSTTMLLCRTPND
jgi:hypothetical protein